MQEIIIPEDGIIYKTEDGNPILQISCANDTTIFSLFSKTEKSKILLVCHDTESGIFIGNGNKNIMLSVNAEKNEIRLTNENGKVTHLIHTTEAGGQIELCDAEANPLISMGPNSNNGDAGLFLRNGKEDSVVTLLSSNGDGNILVKKDDKYCWTANDVAK